MIKYKCIGVKSVTYALKAEKLLTINGISAFTVKLTQPGLGGCGRCVKVPSDRLKQSFDIIKKNGVETTGEIYEL